jgi:hypothetical protein
MKKIFLASAISLLAVILSISLWERESMVESSAATSLPAASFGASAPQTFSPVAASQVAPESGATRASVDVEEVLTRSSNMRALVHEMLRNRDSRSIHIAIEAINRCASFPLEKKMFSENVLAALNQHVAQRWRHLALACEAAGGIDKQQRRAVSSVIKDRYPQLAYLNEPLKGNEAERESIDELMSPLSAARWLDMAVHQGKVNMVLADGTAAPEATSSLAIQVEACSSSSCDPLYAMVVLCAQQGLCSQSTFAEQVSEVIQKEGTVTAENWKLLRTQAKDALLKYFPKIMDRSGKE